MDGEKDQHVSIIESIKPEWTLESRVTKAALSYFGHVVIAGGMEDDMMLGRMNGARKRGRPRQRWLDTLKGYASGATINNMSRDARDRAGWRGAATAVPRGRMRLNGTRRTTRGSHAWKYIPISTSHDAYKFSFIPRTIIAWNQLPSIIIDAPSLDAFRSRLITSQPKSINPTRTRSMHT